MTIIVGYSVYNMKIELKENQERIEKLNGEIANEEKHAEEIKEYEKYVQWKGEKWNVVL